MKPSRHCHKHHGRHESCHGPEHHVQDHEPDSKARDLASFPDGSLVRIERVGDCPCPRCRIFALGLTPGTLVEVVSGGHGPCRLKVRDADVVVGRGIAEKILAVEEEPCPVCAARR
ncbi:MAG TPA: ferrous iron transport protein A [Desulfovibrio sp.]|jgi:ferrous iron transport protein A|nr:ferrous iron transport protein A [Desulfovibrio sp.]